MSPTILEDVRSEPAEANLAACLYCASTDLAPLYSGIRDRLGFVPGERTFLRCQSCGSAVLDPLPKSEALPGFYPPVYSFTLELGGASRFKRWLSRLEYRYFFRPQYVSQVRRVMRSCGWNRGDGKKLLDVGCGRGLRLLEFRRLGFDVHGLDVQPDVVRYLKEELQIPAACADVSAMGQFHAPESFNLITAFQLIEHLPDAAGFVSAAAALLRPGGWLVLANPLFDSVQARLFGRRWINVTEAPRHVSLPTQAGLREIFQSAGLIPGPILADSILNCAGLVGLSLVSSSNLTRAYAGGLRTLLSRGVGAAAALAAIPGCAFENYVLRRPPVGIAFAQKPGGG
jgi:SAM-dependent methyltransferase